MNKRTEVYRVKKWNGVFTSLFSKKKIHINIDPDISLFLGYRVSSFHQKSYFILMFQISFILFS